MRFCKSVYFILLISSIGNSSGVTQVIDASGTYKFGINVVGIPEKDYDPVIRITASNVTLDLEGGAVTQYPTSPYIGTIGIELAENIHDVVIRNGMIVGLAGTAIVIRDGCNDIKLENVFISDCNGGGIYFEGLQTGTGIERIVVDGCVITSCTGLLGGNAQGVTLDHCTTFILNDTISIQNDAGMVADGYGFYITNSGFGRITNCAGNDNGGFNHGAAFYFNTVNDIIMKQSRAVHNVARSPDAQAYVTGFYFENVTNIFCSECEAIDNYDLSGSACGFIFNNGSSNALVQCLAQSNQGSLQSIGVLFTGQTNSTIQNSLIKTNNNQNSDSAYGIYLKGLGNSGCYIAQNSIISNRGVNTSYGVFDEELASTSCFIGNYAFNNGINYQIAYPNGITLPKIVGSLSNPAIGLPSLQAGQLDNVDVSI